MSARRTGTWRGGKRSRQTKGQATKTSQREQREDTSPTPNQTESSQTKKARQAARQITASRKSKKRNARATYLLRAVLAFALSCSISVYRLIQERCLFNSSFGLSPSSIDFILSAVIPHFERTSLLMPISCCTVIPTFAFLRDSLLFLALEGIWVPCFLF